MVGINPYTQDSKCETAISIVQSGVPRGSGASILQYPLEFRFHPEWFSLLFTLFLALSLNSLSSPTPYITLFLLFPSLFFSPLFFNRSFFLQSYMYSLFSTTIAQYIHSKIERAHHYIFKSETYKEVSILYTWSNSSVYAPSSSSLHIAIPTFFYKLFCIFARLLKFKRIFRIINDQWWKMIQLNKIKIYNNYSWNYKRLKQAYWSVTIGKYLYVNRTISVFKIECD